MIHTTTCQTKDSPNLTLLPRPKPKKQTNHKDLVRNYSKIKPNQIIFLDSDLFTPKIGENFHG